MKKKILIWLVLLTGGLVLFSWYSSKLKTKADYFTSNYVNYSSKEAPVKIAVATDLHYLSSKLTDKGPFFTDMFNHADGKNMHYIEEITETFVETIIEEKPEILIISGDLTFNGEKESHLDLERKLSRIQNKGTQILVMPGNHDIARSSAAGFYGDGYEFVDSVSKDEFAQIYQEYGLQESLQKDDNSLSYVYKVRADFWILMLDSNSNKVNQLSEKTFSWLESMLQQAQADGIQVLAVSHQNILAQNPYFKEGFVISRADQLAQLYNKYGVLANLSGHIHIQHFENKDLIEILTSALPVSPHHYGIIDFNGTNLNYQAKVLNVEEWARKKGLNDDNLLHFSESSRKFMEEVAWRKADADLVDSKLTGSERELLLETFAKLNADYFAGQQVNEADYQEGLALWRKNGIGFYGQYIETILESTKKSYDKLNITLE